MYLAAVINFCRGGGEEGRGGERGSETNESQNLGTLITNFINSIHIQRMLYSYRATVTIPATPLFPRYKLLFEPAAS